jgi:hypothetical protein
LDVVVELGLGCEDPGVAVLLDGDDFGVDFNDEELEEDVDAFGADIGGLGESLYRGDWYLMCKGFSLLKTIEVVEKSDGAPISVRALIFEFFL